jgi:hypothetical protein|tara:strand:- start:245 stop:550 length:306 start_codon:yes stop_codon:yes gene_type:complete
MSIDRMQMIKEAARNAARKKQSKVEMKRLIKGLDQRKKEKKEEMRVHKKLSTAAKKEGDQAPGSLDCFKEENMYYSEKEIASYLEGTSYMETWQSMKNDWD